MKRLAQARQFAGIVGFCLVFFAVCRGNDAEALAADRLIKYLYIEANEGDSSGGHAAIRFEDDTFHFQHERSGIIRIKRQGSAAFEQTYAMLGNRTIRESWIAVSAETYDLLHDNFSQLLIIQDEQLRIADNLHQDVALFEFLLAKVSGRQQDQATAALPFPGLGYFSPPQPSPDAGVNDRIASPILADLRDRVRAVYGERFLDQRLQQITTETRTLRLRATTALPLLSRDRYPTPAPGAAVIYREALMAQFAIELLQAAPPIASGSSRSLPGNDFRLSAAERQVLTVFIERLEQELLLLIDSPRRDWGYAFIVGMARLATLQASRDSGSLVLLDIHPDPARKVSASSPTASRYLPAMKSEVEELFRRRRAEFFGDGEQRESDYAALELLGNRLIDLEEAIDANATPRGLPETPVPSRTAWRSELLLPEADTATLEQELIAAKAAEKEYGAKLADLYAYDLFRRNCVTEIFTAINRSFATAAAGNEAAASTAEQLRDVSRQRLGGFVDPTQGLTFIPMFSADEVNACYSVATTQERPSYRSAQLAAMKKRESSLLVFLRESNTITSTIYQPAANDSPFLFFTDDTILLRPVFGAANLLVGLGDSLAGMVSVPFSGTRRLYLGAKGMLFSLPELVFVNLRKGSLEYVAPQR